MMSADHPSGAQRASRQRSLPLPLLIAVAALLALVGLGASPAETRAAGIKVVIVVGPVGSQTGEYISNARSIAAQARSYGATVYEVYSPNATWSRVRSVAQGANLFVYLGHGNGYPSPYGPFSALSRDGMGLNASAWNGNYNVKYYGEYHLANYLDLAPNAAVLLHRLCYASGNSEPGHALPTASVARQRVDNYGAGFLRTGARVVFVDAWRSTRYVLYGLFNTNKSMSQIFWSSSQATRSYAFAFASDRTAGKRGWLDPYWYRGYYRSVVGDLSMTAASWR